MPLSPAVPFRRLDGNTVVIADDIRQRLQTEWTCIVLIGTPRSKLHVDDGLLNDRVLSERQPCPFLRYFLCSDIRIPREPAKAIKIGLRHMIGIPAFVHPRVGNSDEPRDEPFDR